MTGKTRLPPPDGGLQQPKMRFEDTFSAETVVLESMAEAMKARRDELIAQPLQRIWPELAKAALSALKS